MGLFLAACGLSYADYTAVYTANLASSEITNDFTYSQIGRFGSALSGNSVFVYTNGNALRFQGRYANIPGERLKSVAVTNSLNVDFAFKLVNTVTTETQVVVGWRMRTTNAITHTANTYPLYYVSLERNATNGAMSTIQLVKKWEYDNVTGQKVLDKFDYTPTTTINTNLFSWNITSEITATNSHGDSLAITVSVSNNGTAFCTLSATEIPTGTGSNSTFTGATQYGIGIAAGQIINNGTFVGIDLLKLVVSESGGATVVKSNQTIGAFLPADASAFLTTNAVGLSATASSGLGVAFAVGSGAATISGLTNLAFTGAGEVKIVASQAGDSSWNPAPNVTNTFSVTKATPIVTNPPAASAITYGQALSNSVLSSGAASVPGTFAFTTPAMVPDQGTADQSVTFTPTDAAMYAAVVFNVSVTVNKAAPAITTPPTASAITYGQALSNSVLSGGEASEPGTFDWTDGTIVPNAGKAPQSVTFTPTDLDNFSPAVFNVSVTVNQAATTVTTWPTATAIIYGQALSNSVLSVGAASVAGTFAFTAPATVPSVGMADYSVTFTPSSANYLSVVGTASVTVNKADQTIDFPAIGDKLTNDTVILSATASSGLTVDFSVASGPGSISGGTTLTFTGTGTVGIAAAQVGNGNFNPAPSVTNVFVVREPAAMNYVPVYTANLASSDVTNDFIYSQVGNIGSAWGANSTLVYTNNSVRFMGKYSSKPGARLNNVCVTNSLNIDFSFRLFNTVTSETQVVLGWRMKTNQTANTYPLYYVSLERNATNGAMCTIQLLKKWESASAYQRVLAKHDYVPTGTINSNVFSWNITSQITKTNQFGDSLAITVSVSNNGAAFCTLSAIEPALERTGSNWTISSSAQCGVGIAAGPIPNNGTFAGMDLLKLVVSEDTNRPVSVPEFTLGAIGNSFTYYNNTYPYIFYDLAAVGGHAVATNQRTLAGRTLKQHCTETNTLDWIVQNACEYYVINELSLNASITQGIYYAEWRTNEFPYYADMMIDTIQVHHAEAKIFLYEPWAPKTNILAMAGFNSQPDLTALYTNFVAAYVNVDVMPFGRAMQRVHQQHANPDPPVLSGDASEHPGPAGTYLIACVVYSKLYDASPEGFPYFKDTWVTTAINLTNRNYAFFLQRIGYDTYKRTTFANPPQVAVTIPDRAPPSTDIPFSVEATDNGNITNYLWSFGDGTFASGPDLTSVTHQYPAATNGYDVNVTVQDDSGEWERWGRWLIVATNAQIISGFMPTNGSAFATNDVIGLSATASSGLEVSFAVSSGPGSLAGTNLSFTGTGTVVVVASQAGDANWTAAPSVTNIYTVTGGGGGSLEEQFAAWLADEQGQDPNDPNFAPDADYDQDTQTTWKEFLADTNPNASNSVFRVEGTYTPGSGQMRLEFPASSNRFYQLYAVTNLLLPGQLTDLGWGTPGMAITNQIDGSVWLYWGFRALLAEPASP
jgi:hypothetical protein